jgi:signal transduction histidine kinase
VETDHPLGGLGDNASLATLTAIVLSTAKAQELIRVRRRPEALVAVAIAAAALAGSVALLSHGGVGPGARPGQLDLATGLLAACSTLPIVVWRRAPLAVFAATTAGSIVLAGLGSSLGLPLGPTAALYLLAASRDERSPWTRRTTIAVVGLFVGYLTATAVGQGDFPASELFHTALAWAVAWFAGERTRLRHEHIAVLKERAVNAERDAERESRLAAAEERARIARDLHDSAGHAINVIVVRAGAARMRHDEDPERSRAALAIIEEIARQTAADIDHIVGALRDPHPLDGTVEAPPGLASLAALVAQHAAADLEVTVATRGTPRALSVAVDHAVYRILQEALTNASRHGTGTASVELAFGETTLDVTVANPVPANGAKNQNGGHGLIGMRERAALVGGTLDDEPAAGVFRVRAHLCYDRP